MKALKLAAAALLAGMVLGACSAQYSPAPASPAAPAVSASPAVAHKAAAKPVTVSGHGESVVTVTGLVPGTTYKLAYSATGGQGMNALVVDAVEPDGSTVNLIDGIGDTPADLSAPAPPLTGTTIGVPDAATKVLHVSNDDGESWTLTFTPVG